MNKIFLSSVLLLLVSAVAYIGYVFYKGRKEEVHPNPSNNLEMYYWSPGDGYVNGKTPSEIAALMSQNNAVLASKSQAIDYAKSHNLPCAFTLALDNGKFVSLLLNYKSDCSYELGKVVEGDEKVTSKYGFVYLSSREIK